MRYISLIIIFFISLILISCEEKALYKSLTEREYHSLKAKDTIINTPKLLVTCTGDAGRFNDMETILVLKSIGNRPAFFKLAPDVYFENNSTIIEYQGFFSSAGEDGSFQKDGIWVYTDFYKNFTGSGMNFAVDSLPVGCNDTNRPRREGLYFYSNKRLKRISAGQSEDEFTKFGKDGFYFIPNSGRFFKRYNANIIK